ncbi:MAG: UDP-N-acetylmuramyl-tripeptide synthetase [Candidatus Magasanikbacteria bacterium]
MKKLVKKIIPRSVRNLRHLLVARKGAKKYGFPSEELFVIGVTGTSGKSSTIDFLRQTLESVGFRVGSLSTVDFYVAGKQTMNDQKMTMLGLAQIQKYLRKMVEAKCDIAIVETTSEGFLQYRHKYINYDTVVLTNLYPEHIDAHGSFDNYKGAKLGIFEYVSQCRKKTNKKLENFFEGEKSVPKRALVNGNCANAKEFLSFPFDESGIFYREDEIIYADKAYGNNGDFSLSAKDVEVKKEGLYFTVGEISFFAPLFGAFNVMNILPVIAILRSLSVDWKKIQKAIEKLKGVPGRLEFIPEAKKHGFQVIVDYAFEPIAIEALYEVVKLQKPKRIIHVFGSTGGGRDISRRFTVGEFVGNNADIVIVTDEDPYDDNPMDIIRDVRTAVEKTGKKLDKNIFEVLDRKEAIHMALNMAHDGDIVLITGKGSEQGMVVKGKMIPFDDRQIVRNMLLQYSGHTHK